MNRSKITKKSIIYIQLIYCIIFEFLISVLGISPMISYITDIFWALSFVFILDTKIIHKNMKKEDRRILIFSLSFFFYTLIGIFFSGVSPILYVWFFRNNFRFIIFFFACKKLLNKNDIGKIFQILYVIFIIDIGLSFIQYLQKFPQDAIGGIFGTSYGMANTTNHAFILIMSIYAIAYLFYDKIKISKFLVIAVGSLFIASLAEIKMFYFEFVILLGVYFFLSKPSVKKIFVAIFSVLILLVGVGALYRLYPQFNEFISIEKITEYLNEGYGGRTDGITRINGFTLINNMFFKSGIGNLFIGVGFGNAQYSTTFDALKSYIYIMNPDLYYYWFTYAWIFLEGGIIGLIFYMFFHFLNFKTALRIKKDPAALMAKILIVFTLFIIFYNCSLQIANVGFLYYFIFAIPYILLKENSNERMHVDV